MSEKGRIYKVEKIIGRKEDREGNIFYRVHWVGYGPRYDSWEPVGNLGSCEDLIEEFYEHQTALKSPADRYYLRSRHVARAGSESSSSDDEFTPKSKAKMAKRTPVRRQKKEKSKSPVRRTKQTLRADKEEEKQQEEEKEQPSPQVEKPLPAKLQEAQKEEPKPPQPRQSTETSASVTAGLFARTYDLRSAHQRQATSRLEISSDDDETTIAGGTPTQQSTIQARMTLSESKFRSRLAKVQHGQTTVPLDSSPSVTRRLQFTSTISKEPEEEKEEEQVTTSRTVEQSSLTREAIVPSGSSTPEELKEERVPAWMQIARAEVGFAVLVTLFGLVGYFCYFTDHCSRFYH